MTKQLLLLWLLAVLVLSTYKNNDAFSVRPSLTRPKFTTALKVIGGDTITVEEQRELATSGALNMATLDVIGDDRICLEILKGRLDEALTTVDTSDMKKLVAITNVNAVVIDRMKRTAPPSERAPKVLGRLERVDFDIMEQPLIHEFDLDRFKNQVLDLFDWYKDTNEVKHYMAPYFPLIQSSGMGKTKLMFELRKYVNQNLAPEVFCKTVLCERDPSQDKNFGEDAVYSANLVPPPGKQKQQMKDICRMLDAIVSDISAPKVILLFDESQSILDYDGFAFRCIRWWLTLKRKERQIVAVFTGTSSRLTNFYREPPETTTSRDAKSFYHETLTNLYEPFYMINTIGMFAWRRNPSSFAVNDYERAIPYGRPLFAAMQQKESLNEEALLPIVLRMLVESRYVESSSLSACLSILGTRLQMGQTTVDVASDLVAKGYAVLSHYDRSKDAKGGVDRIYFPTDPVCARLAMCLMDGDWTLPSPGGDIWGKNKLFWTRKMSEIFSTGLCLPFKGDLGELAAAFYLLSCGDVIRKRIDRDYRTFSVPLSKFVQLLLNPNTDAVDEEADTSSFHYTDAHVSFIQVVRNYIRFPQKDLGDQGFLEQLYMSGTAFYCYPNCVGYDLVASIRLSNANEVIYVPLFVSMSTKPDISKDKMSKLRDAMKNTTDTTTTFGMGIRLVFGENKKPAIYQNVSETSQIPSEEIQTAAGENLLPPRDMPITAEGKQALAAGAQMHAEENKAKSTGKEAPVEKKTIITENILLTKDDVKSLLQRKSVVKVVFVPPNDPFGVTDLLETTSCGPVKSEVTSSHSFLFCHSKEKVSSSSLLRCDPKKDDLMFLEALRAALLNAKSNSAGSE